MSARDVIASEFLVWGGECLIEAYPAHRQGAYENTDRILATLRSAGFAVVPVEPTEGMKEAGYLAKSAGCWARDIYQAMITAAQEDSRG